MSDKSKFINYILVDAIIKLYARNTEDFFFIEIGAADGIVSDFFHKYILKYKWKGILVEPVKYLFDKLVRNYKGQSNLIFENVAISNKNEIRNFYRLKETADKLPFWCHGLGSFDLDVVLKHKRWFPDIEKYLIIEKIKCITLNNLLNRYDVKKVDLLQIDTEGFDYTIIKSFNFNFIKPKIIRYEHKHLSKMKKEECLIFLKNKGYSTFKQNAEDTFAFKLNNSR